MNDIFFVELEHANFVLLHDIYLLNTSTDNLKNPELNPEYKSHRVIQEIIKVIIDKYESFDGLFGVTHFFHHFIWTNLLLICISFAGITNMYIASQLRVCIVIFFSIFP